ncbi:uncharacterized protein LOC119174033 isoform X1 [Rhipicephalus microplus]|uniref:uncharacterized protein LOC119174033 isoform X1 n=1 Tax=Rhipicephalus microplus TaxID=6941 RepID=UPI003F6B9F74
MKQQPTLLLAALLACASGSSVNQQKTATRTGTSTHFKTQDSQGNYRFGYDVVHSSGSSFHKEESTNGVKVGSYGLRDVDGRVRIVNYVADAQGFRADVQTNEPAVDPVKDSATTGQAVPSVDLMAVNASSGEDTAVIGPTEIPAASSTMVSSSVSVEPSGYPERAGGDVVPPKVLIDAADDVPRRTKPRPPVFPPPKEVDAPRRPGPPKRTALRYPFYVDATDVHVVGPVPPAFPRRGFQLSQGGFPFTSPLSPATFGYFPAGATELHPAAMHPAYYANAASAFLHSMQLRHFPFGQLKWPYHAPFLPPPLVVF